MGRLGCVLLALSLLWGGSRAEAGDAPAKNVGVLWYSKSGMAQRVYAGFLEVIQKKAPQIAVELKGDIAQEDDAIAQYDAWQGQKDAILFLRSHGATHMGAHPPKVPGFIGASNDPVALGIMKDGARPDGNITGVTYSLPLGNQISLFRQLLPEMKSLCLLVMEGHPSSAIEQAGTKAACEAAGIAYFDAVCKDKADLADTVAKMKDQVDAFILGNQNLLIDNGDIVAASSGNKPVFSYSQQPVEKGHAVMGLVADDHKLGMLLGQAVIEVLVNGKAVADVPVQIDPDPKVYFCLSKIRQWGLKPPLALMKVAIKVD